jgi:AAA domain-containing protein/UvrD-like helicase family protein
MVWMGAPAATPEQLDAIDAFGTGRHLVLQAGAGTGKTTALTMLGASTRRTGLYVAFNKAIAVEAATRFGDNVTCRTGHALAMAAVGYRYRSRLDAPRVPTGQIGQALGVPTTVRIGRRQVSDRALAYSATETVKRFCHSADPVIGTQHVPPLRGVESGTLHAELADVVLPFARAVWADLQDAESGTAMFQHDHYLKMWALTNPVLAADFLLLDEAQDTNPVIEAVFNAQRDHAQLVLVGDSAQAIYGWRGARDVMSGFDGITLPLSQSFRFGPVLAREANRWLAIADAPIRLEGAAGLDTTIGPVERPDVILCRTNAGAMLELMRLLAARRRVALVGGGGELRKLALAARDLKNGRRPGHPELMLFAAWAEVQEYAYDDPSGRDLLPLVDAVDQHGVDTILNAVGRLSDEAGADVTVSTAHRAKGREWGTVRVGDDFTEPERPHRGGSAPSGPSAISAEEARVAYVAVTRARYRLDLGGLAWINDHPQGRDPRPSVRDVRPSVRGRSSVPASTGPSRDPLAPSTGPVERWWRRVGRR